MADRLSLDARDRILVLAPHPDDESLAVGGLLRICALAGAALRVVYLTDGENNAWAQRRLERRLVIGPADRRRFAKLRRWELALALAALGVDEASAAEYWSLPDQGLTAELLSGRNQLADRIAGTIRTFAPTLLLAPSLADLHPDHSAVAVLSSLALASLPASARPRALAYLVHHPNRDRLSPVAEVALDTAGVAAKRAAIGRHGSQLVWRRTWLLSFAEQHERYYDPAGSDPGHPVQAVEAIPEGLRLRLRLRPHLRAAGPRTLLLAGAGLPGMAVRVPSFPARTAVLGGGHRLAAARWRGGPFAGTLELPLPPERPLFAKLSRAIGFFDEAGWREITAAAPPSV